MDYVPLVTRSFHDKICFMYIVLPFSPYTSIKIKSSPSQNSKLKDSFYHGLQIIL